MGTGWGKFYCRCSGDYGKAMKYLNKACDDNLFRGVLQKYGEMGVDALERATPVDTGKTASSWYYEIENKGSNGKVKRWSINWYNSNENKNVNIALLIQYGHGTYQGTYVQGIDYINPAMKPVFDLFIDEICGEVKAL